MYSLNFTSLSITFSNYNITLMSTVHESVQKYYGQELSTNEDLKTNACCPAEAPPKYIRDILSNIHDDVITKYYGCGLTIPDQLNGLKVLDLGSGSGRKRSSCWDRYDG